MFSIFEKSVLQFIPFFPFQKYTDYPMTDNYSPYRITWVTALKEYTMLQEKKHMETQMMQKIHYLFQNFPQICSDCNLN